VVVVDGQTMYGPSARAKITFPKSFFVNGYVDGVPDAFEPARKIQVGVQNDKVPASVTPAEVLKQLTGIAATNVKEGSINGMASIQGIVNKNGRWIHLYILKDENSKVDDAGNPQSKRDLFLITFSVPQGYSKAFEAEADQIMQSFKRITAAEGKAVKPAVIRTRAVRGGDTVASLAAKQPFGPYNELFFRTFNGLDGNAEPKVGSWIKYVE